MNIIPYTVSSTSDLIDWPRNRALSKRMAGSEPHGGQVGNPREVTIEEGDAPLLPT